MSATVAVLLAAVVGGLILVDRNRHIDDDEPTTATTLSPIAIPARVQLTVHTGLVEAIDISADGRLVVTADDTTLRVVGLVHRSPTTRDQSRCRRNDKRRGPQCRRHIRRGSPIRWPREVLGGRRRNNCLTVSCAVERTGLSTRGGVRRPGPESRRQDGSEAGPVHRGDLGGFRDRSSASSAWCERHGLHSCVQPRRDDCGGQVRQDGATVAAPAFDELPVVDLPAYQATAERMKFSPDGTRIAFTVENKVIIQRIEATP